MNNGNGNHAMGLDGLKSAAQSERVAFVESAEEVNFRLSALLRAYTSPSPDVATIHKRACVFRDSVDEFKELVHRFIDAFESNRGGSDSK